MLKAWRSRKLRRRFSSALLAPIHSRSLLFCARQFRKHALASASAIFRSECSRRGAAGNSGDVSRPHFWLQSTRARFCSAQGNSASTRWLPRQRSSDLNAQGVAQPETQETFLVRTSGSNPLALASVLRKAIPQARAGFRVSDLRTQSDLVRAQTVRERLLAMLAAFFSFVALLLAAVGLYGVLSYSVQQREREFGIRIAVGARIGDIAWQATSRIFLMVMTGAVIGAALGIASVRYVETLLYGVKGSEPVMLTGPALVLLAIALLSALPVIVRASRIDPKIMLRAE